MKIVSAYDYNDKLVEGEIYKNKKGELFIINEFGEYLKSDEIKTFRIVEDLDDSEVQDKVNDDLNQLDIENNKKLKSLSDTDVEKTGEEREKELKASGMAIKDGAYKDKFVSSVKAAKTAGDMAAGNVSNSEAFKNLKESDSEELDDDIDENLTVDEVDNVNTCTPELDPND